MLKGAKCILAFCLLQKGAKYSNVHAERCHVALGTLLHRHHKDDMCNKVPCASHTTLHNTTVLLAVTAHDITQHIHSVDEKKGVNGKVKGSFSDGCAVRCQVSLGTFLHRHYYT